MNVYSEVLEKCRICKSKNLHDVIHLGEQIITSRFPEPGEIVPKTNITLCMCQDCYLLQLNNTTECSEMYEHLYGYRSGLNNTMRTHLKEYQQEILSKVVNLKPGDTILDIGSNDSTMLNYYSPDYTRIGMDPTGIQFKEFYGKIELVPTYFTESNFRKHYQQKCKIVSSISMFYDLPDPVQFATDIYNILEDDGIWTCEQSYMLTMIETNSIDTICHEHLEYYSIYNIKMIADLANFKIIDICFNKCNGGSFRIYFAKQDSQKYTEYDLTEMIDNEFNYGIKTKDIYNTFMKNCDIEINKLKTFIFNKNINIYGASTKGNCLLQYSNIGPEQIPYAVERNPRKYGKTTSTGIHIISEESMRENPPDYLLVLPWHFRDEIIEREDKFLQCGGKLIFPFPQFEIYSQKPKIMITGQNGMIGTYFRKEFDNYEYFDYSIEFIPIIKPDIIIHLAGISNSQYAKDNCLESIKTNGMMACEICDIIYKNGLKTKFFNASSSEIFKGHINYTITDNDNNFKHLHPYSIGKILSHTTVDWYRKTYGLPFSNGIIFTTESPLKKPTFLLNKVAKHIHSWKKDGLPLCLGNLDSYRNIIHVSDVINAINLIVSQEQGDNYVICGKESEKVLYLVLMMYYIAGMEVSEKSNGFYSNGKLLFYIDGSFNESFPTNINGIPENLTNLGWEQRKSIDFILEELVINESCVYF